MIQLKFYEAKTIDELKELEKTTEERLETIRYAICEKESES